MLGNALMPPPSGASSPGMDMPVPGNPLLSAPLPMAAPAQPATYEPERSTAGFGDRVSTRIPTAAGLGFDPHTRSDLSVGHGASLPGSVSDPKQQKKLEKTYRANANIIRKYYGNIDPGITDDDAHKAFMDHAHDNIVHLWNTVKSRPWVPLAVDW
jgi:hypothetical protein